jgi:hypothetical protein
MPTSIQMQPAQYTCGRRPITASERQHKDRTQMRAHNARVRKNTCHNMPTYPVAAVSSWRSRQRDRACRAQRALCRAQTSRIKRMITQRAHMSQHVTHTRARPHVHALTLLSGAHVLPVNPMRHSHVGVASVLLNTHTLRAHVHTPSRSTPHITSRSHAHPPRCTCPHEPHSGRQSVWAQSR